MRRQVVLACCLSVIFLGGCASTYVTPAGGVSLADITDSDLLVYYDRKPLSPFPANLAVLRVQDSNYYAYNDGRRHPARYNFVTARDIGSGAAVETIAGLPLIDGVAPIGRLLLPPHADSLEDLRGPAAQLRADMLLVYTVDTTFIVDGKSLGPLSLISLGMIPNKKAHVTATVAGVLVDVRSGFIYGTTEATSTEVQKASVWSTALVIESARKRAEEHAFHSFIDEFADLWSGVVEVYAASPAAETSRVMPAQQRQARQHNSWYHLRFSND